MAFWKEEPSEDTALEIKNLSRAERYIPATAGANGDFWVDIDGADGLEAGDILRIAFPAATNSASNARLSINGASGTYRNIFYKNGRQLKAVSNQNFSTSVYYDGTNFVIKELPDMVVLNTSTIVVGNTFNITEDIYNFRLLLVKQAMDRYLPVSVGFTSLATPTFVTGMAPIYTATFVNHLTVGITINTPTSLTLTDSNSLRHNVAGNHSDFNNQDITTIIGVR